MNVARAAGNVVAIAAAFGSAVLLASCASHVAVAPQESTPALAVTEPASRVVLLSFDGLGADALARQTGLPSFERLGREGASSRVTDVDAALTPRDSETLLEAARRQGKRVGVVPLAAVDDRPLRRAADFWLAWSDALTESRVIALDGDDFRREWVPPTWTAPPPRRRSFSPVMRARTSWGTPAIGVADVDVVAYDTTDDAVENYDLYAVEVSGQEVPVDGRGWFAVSRRGCGSWSKFLRASPSLGVTMHWGAVSCTEAWPESFRTRVLERAGFWPGMPEEDGSVDTATFVEQLERLASFHTRAQRAAIEEEQFDLLLLSQPQIAVAGRMYAGLDEADAVIRAAFVAADDAVVTIAAALAPGDAFIVTGAADAHVHSGGIEAGTSRNAGVMREQEMHPPFFAIGAGVPRGAFGELQQAAIARFAAALLGISPPGAPH